MVKAGLLASLPNQRPSRPVYTEQWHTEAEWVPFSPKRAGLQRRDRSRFTRDSHLGRSGTLFSYLGDSGITVKGVLDPIIAVFRDRLI
jgi:hypothetical protein